jgi:hypothetical protein
MKFSVATPHPDAIGVLDCRSVVTVEFAVVVPALDPILIYSHVYGHITTTRLSTVRELTSDGGSLGLATGH